MRETMYNWDRKPGLCRVGRGLLIALYPKGRTSPPPAGSFIQPFALAKKRMNQVSK